MEMSKQKKNVSNKRNLGSIGLGLDRGKFKDWHCGPDYKCEKILGQGSYGSVA